MVFGEFLDEAGWEAGVVRWVGDVGCGVGGAVLTDGEGDAEEVAEGGEGHEDGEGFCACGSAEDVLEETCGDGDFGGCHFGFGYTGELWEISFEDALWVGFASRCLHMRRWLRDTAR